MATPIIFSLQYTLSLPISRSHTHAEKYITFLFYVFVFIHHLVLFICFTVGQRLKIIQAGEDNKSHNNNAKDVSML
jgi:hypothetical protein